MTGCTDYRATDRLTGRLVGWLAGWHLGGGQWAKKKGKKGWGWLAAEVEGKSETRKLETA